MRAIFYILFTYFCVLVVFAASISNGPKGAQLRDGWYFIKNPETGKYLQVSGAKNADAAGNVVISSGTKDKGQKWKLTNIGDGLVTLTSALGDYNMDVANEDRSNGANIQLYKPNGRVSQQFMILKTRTEDVYTIGTKVSYFEKAIDIDNGRSADGTNVLQWTNEMKVNQCWMFERDGDSEEETCWSLALGYPCCSKCSTIYYQDDNGNWGIESNDWCGLLSHCR